MKTSHLALAAAALLSTLTLTAAASEGRHGEGEGEEASERRSDSGGHGRRAGPGDLDPAYAKECGACHLAFPPSMLPAASWRRMMGELDRHFGQNAELDDATRARLEGWLVARAGGDPRGGGAPQRITALPWFVKEHRKVPADAVARPAIRSLANCAACHQGAAQWDFEEDRVRIPR